MDLVLLSIGNVAKLFKRLKVPTNTFYDNEEELSVIALLFTRLGKEDLERAFQENE